MADLEHGLTIHELELTENISGDFFVAVDDGTNTKKAKVANLNSASATSAQTYAQAAAASAAASASSATQAQTSAQSIQSAMVQATSQLQGYVDDAAASASNAAASEANIRGLITSDYAKLARSYATGDSGCREGEETDNAKYYSEQSESYVDAAEAQAVIAGQKADLSEDHAEESEDHALESEGHALGTQNGTPVSSDSPYYHNNAKYWADEARQSSAGGVAASVIATAEPTNISTHAYAIGDQFVYNGILYTATSAISVGATITPGTNCTIADKLVYQIGEKQNMVLASALTIGGQEITEVELALRALNEKGGGHTILDEDGETYPQRSKLQFNGAKVSDDETNDATVVDTVNPVEYEEDIYGVNLLPNNAESGSHRGITYTVNSDKTISVNGTAIDGNSVFNFYEGNLPEGNYLLSGGISEDCKFAIRQTSVSSWMSNSTGNDVPVTIERNVSYTALVWVKNGTTVNNLTFRPMLRKATIQDDTYRPFNQQSIQNQLTDQTNVSGAKNRMKITTDTKTNYGVTYTFHRDSKGNVTKIVPTGTATANSFCTTWNRLDDEPLKGLEKGKEYILSGDYGLGAGNGYIYVNFYTGTTRISGAITGGTGETKFIIPNEADALDFGVGILNGKSAPLGFAFYPMIRDASDPDSTYVPYAMTNRELTESVKITTLTSDNNLNDVIKAGKYYFNSTPTNSPENSNHCAMIVMARAENLTDLKQMIFKDTKIYTRSYDGTTWSSWYKFTGTVLS